MSFPPNPSTGGGAGGGTWGSITGTLSDQTDLNTSLTAKASSTAAALSILVYDGTPSAGDLTTYDEIYTTPALCFAALPAIINHAVTITMRKADGSAYAAATLQRVVSGGSITIQGEYYYNNTVASAGSTVGKFNTQAGDTGVASGDKVLMLKYSGTVGASRPSDAFIDTVAGVSGTEITLTTRTTDAFDNTWRYVIVRTECGAITISNTINSSINGVLVTSSASPAVHINSSGVALNSVIVEASGKYGVQFTNSRDSRNHTYVGINHTYASTAGRAIFFVQGSNQRMYNLLIQSSMTSGYLVYCDNPGRFGGLYLYAKSLADTTAVNGVVAIETIINLNHAFLDGKSSDYKLGTALYASAGGRITTSSIVFGDNITTQKSPANWAATTDGSYIS